MADNETPPAASSATLAAPAAGAPTATKPAASGASVTPGAPAPATNAPVESGTPAAASMVAQPAGTPTTAELPKEGAAEKAHQAAEKAKSALSKIKKSGLWSHVSGISKDLSSPDQATRKMARYFFFSVAGIFAVLVATVIYIHQEHARIALENSAEREKSLGESLAKQAEEAKEKYSSQSLGTFTIELKAPAGTDKKASNVMNLAEVEIVVSCDEKETCNFLEDNMPQVRNQLTDIFVAMERDELLSKEGKRRLKNRVIQKLNDWLPKGKVENLFFDKLVIN